MSHSSVHLLAMGGTIANPPEKPGYISGEELVGSVSELDDIADVTVTNVRSKASSALDYGDWLALRDEIRRILKDHSPDGIVVTLGSNTASETAYFLELTTGTVVPIALTAAQRNFGMSGNDGNRNLIDAVRTVSSPAAAGRGVLVVVNDQIHAARDVAKVVSGRPDAWESGDFGPVGLVDKYGRVEFYRRLDRVHTKEPPFVPPDDAKAFPTVKVIYSAVDDDGSSVEAAVDAGADGLVLAAYPTGSASKRDGRPDQREALERARDADVSVVVSHRGTQGWPASTYHDDDRFVWGDTLVPSKARTLLTLALVRTNDPERIQKFFDTF
ncbi:asparaginase [Halorarum salinum]|uniref:Asparaginase n=1 Tax=Halorarum salinum TaxID=2743089 RepID=A0A7D5L888_9EURY|nr:asparaginase [Halobaculum salinum]QLG60331.1 asparaginase [Halobaculum salinum]